MFSVPWRFWTTWSHVPRPQRFPDVGMLCISKPALYCQIPKTCTYTKKYDRRSCHTQSRDREREKKEERRKIQARTKKTQEGSARIAREKWETDERLLTPLRSHPSGISNEFTWHIVPTNYTLTSPAYKWQAKMESNTIFSFLSLL